MTKTMHIEGMMCGHCEATVKKALEALPEVTSAEVSHEAGTAVVTLSSEVADDVLKKTVEEKDYKSSACTRTAVCVCTWIVYDRGISNDRSKNNVL